MRHINRRLALFGASVIGQAVESAKPHSHLDGQKAESSMGPPLRFGIVLDSPAISLWQSECLDKILETGGGQLDVVIFNDVSPMRSTSFWNRLAWACFKRLFGRCTLDRSADARQLVGRPTLRLSEGRTRVDKRLADLDFALSFSQQEPSGFSSLPRYGIWFFTYGLRAPLPPSAALLEFLQNKPIVRVALESNEDLAIARTTLREGWFAVVRHSYSATLKQMYTGSLDFPALACRDIRTGRSGMWSTYEPPKASSTDHRPLIFLTLQIAAKVLLRWFQSQMRAAFFRREWNIGTISASHIKPMEATIARGVRWFPNGKDRDFVADCFIHFSRDEHVILGELLDREEGRGAIAAWRGQKSDWEFLGPVLEEPGCHLSYPFIFSFQGSTYCLPERTEAGPPFLYRAVQFPTRWECLGELLPGVKAIDPTIFQFEGRWWLAYTDPIDRQGRLMLWHSASPLGPWKPHAGNPVKIDPRSARSAGAPFIRDGYVIRPAQDCSVNYGSRVVFNLITQLTSDVFSEEGVGAFSPDPKGPYPDGLHTISVAGSLAAIDGSRYVLDPLAWFHSRRQKRRKAERLLRAVRLGVEKPLSTGMKSGPPGDLEKRALS